MPTQGQVVSPAEAAPEGRHAGLAGAGAAQEATQPGQLANGHSRSGSPFRRFSPLDGSVQDLPRSFGDHRTTGTLKGLAEPGMSAITNARQLWRRSPARRRRDVSSHLPVETLYLAADLGQAVADAVASAARIALGETR